jgi:hypothetical protein
LELLLPDMLFTVDNGRIGQYPFMVKQDSGVGKEGYIRVEVRSDVPGDLNADSIEIHYQTYSSVSDFLLRPVPMMISVALLIILSIAVTLLVRRRRGRRTSI